jgi:hypothetical protein
VIGLVATTGCVFSSDEGIGPLDVTMDQASLIVVDHGASLTVNATITREDGVPIHDSDYHWAWGRDGEDVGYTWVEHHVGPGHEQMVATFSTNGMFELAGTATARNTTPLVTPLPDNRVVVWGGPDAGVAPLDPAVAMVVGEQRPVAAWPLARADDGSMTFGDQQITAAIDNAAVATIDGTFVVTAAAPGTATLTFSNGTDTATVPVTVTAGVLGPPADASYTLGAAFIGTVAGSTPNDLVAIDSHGWPAAIVGVDSAHVVLARWTGSGFGYEWVSDPWDTARDAHVVVDDQDHIWITYKTGARDSFMLVDRPSETPNAWRRRRLHGVPDGALQAGFSEERLAHGDPAESQAAMLARPGGGVWVAHWHSPSFERVAGVYQGFEVDAQCLDLIRLAATRDDAGSSLSESDVSKIWYQVPPDVARCHDETRADTALFVLPDTDVPQIIAWYPRVDSNAAPQLLDPQSYVYRGDTWVGEAAYDHDGGASGGLRYLATAGPAQLLLAFDSDVGAIDPASAHPLYGLAAGGQVYSSLGALAAWQRATPFGGVVTDSPALGWAPASPGAAAIAAAGSGSTIAAMYRTANGALTLGKHTTPSVALETDSELTGRRQGHSAATPVPATEPIVLSGGTRVVLTATSVARSPANDWTFLEWPVQAPLAGATRLWAVGNNAYATDAAGLLVRGLGATNWTVVTTESLVANPLIAETISPAGAAWGVQRAGTDFVVSHDADVSDGLTWSPIGGLGATQLSCTGQAVLLATATGVMLAMQCTASTNDVLLVRTYASDSSIVDERIVPLAADPVLLDKAVLAGDGSLVWPAVRAATNTLVMSRLAPSATTATSVDLDVLPAGTPAVELTTLADGRVALADATLRADARVAAVLRTSTTGASWSTPAALRATGGGWQQPVGIAVQPDGELLINVLDNQGFSGGTPDWIVVRLAAP